MRFALRRPEGPLADFVNRSVVLRRVRAAARQRAAAAGRVQELVINLREDEMRVWDRRDLTRYQRAGRSGAGGAAQRILRDRYRRAAERNGGAFPRRAEPSRSLECRRTKCTGSRFRCATCGAGSRANCASDCWRWKARRRASTWWRRHCCARYGVRSALHPAVGFAIGEFGGGRRRSVADVCAETGLSARRFIELFRARWG